MKTNYIYQQLDSICGLKGNFEFHVLIRNDEEDDCFSESLKRYKEKIDITYFSGKNVGPRESFMNLVRCAPDSDYYAFCDQDDIWYPEKFIFAISQLEKLHKYPALYFSNVDLVDSDGKSLNKRRDVKIPQFSLENLFVSNPALGCTMVYNRELHCIIKDIPTDHFFMHDVIAILSAAAFGKVIYDFRPSIAYRQHNLSVTQGHSFFKNIRNKFEFWFIKREINIADQARILLDIAEIKQLCIKHDTEHVLKTVKNYKKGINRLRLAFNEKYRINSRNCNRSFVIRVILGLA